MRLLSFDPGGEKLGWAVLDASFGPVPGPRYGDSGVFRWPRDGQPYQDYRVKLTKAVRSVTFELIDEFDPDRIAIEVVPAIGGEGFMRSGQGYIANVVATTIHNCAFERGVPFVQVSARTWESRIALRKDKSEKVTKPKVRNGVLTHLPDLKATMSPDQLKQWDRWDALGIGLNSLGYETVF